MMPAEPPDFAQRCTCDFAGLGKRFDIALIVAPHTGRRTRARPLRQGTQAVAGIDYASDFGF